MGVMVVGIGEHGLRRAVAVGRATRRLRLVALFDHDPALAEQVAARLGVVAVPDLGTGLDSRGVDVVVIATPPETRSRLVAQALSAGKHVLCEAPLAIRASDARVLAKRAGAQQLRLGSGLPSRFDPPIEDALTLVDSWGIGRVESVRVEVGHRASLGFLQSWRTDVARSGGGALMHHGPLACDLIRRLLGEVILAKGFVRQEVRLPPGCESEAFGLFRNHDNAFAELHVSWNQPTTGLGFEVRGESGYLRGQTHPWRLSGRLSDGRSVRRWYLRDRADEQVHRARFGCGRSMVAELNAFAGSSSPPIWDNSGWDATHAIEMIQAIYQADRTGDEVYLNRPLAASLRRVG